jgi:serine/threonine protein kinase
VFAQIDFRRLYSYILNFIKNAEIKSSPTYINSGRITAPLRLGGGISSTVYAFSLILPKSNEFNKLNFVLKTYDRNEKNRCYNEGMILKALYHKNFPVPYVYAVETSDKLIGAPFILMEKVKGIPLGKYIKKIPSSRRFTIIKRFAETLLHLHSLDWGDLKFLKQPEDAYDYARRQGAAARLLQKNLNVASNIDIILNWIEENAHKHPCYHYAILHGDMHLDNFLVTENGKIVVVDWEIPEIGDPLKDIALAYHNLIFAFGPQRLKEGLDVAKFFIHEIKSLNKKIDNSTLCFYAISSALIEMICYKFRYKQFLNPLTTMQKIGAKYFLAFPLLCWYFWWRSKLLEHFLLNEVKSTKQSYTRQK